MLNASSRTPRSPFYKGLPNSSKSRVALTALWFGSYPLHLKASERKRFGLAARTRPRLAAFLGHYITMNKAMKCGLCFWRIPRTQLPYHKLTVNFSSGCRACEKKKRNVLVGLGPSSTDILNNRRNHLGSNVTPTEKHVKEHSIHT